MTSDSDDLGEDITEYVVLRVERAWSEKVHRFNKQDQEYQCRFFDL